jgi:hypothetical protein
MAPLFKRKAEPNDVDAHAQAELDRFRALAPVQLAQQLLPAFGPSGIAHARGGIAPQALCKWLVVDVPGVAKFNPLQLLLPVREALQQLEHGSLVTSSGRDRATIWRITSTGEGALADGSVAAHLSG